MGGYLGAPQRILEKQIGDVKFTIHRVADILNRDDPDVSFAYCFCGSQGASFDGKSDPAKEAAERGRQKAKIEYHDAEWPSICDLWAKSLTDLGTFKLDVWDYGHGDSVADVQINGVIKDKTYSICLSIDEIDIVLTARSVGAHGVVRLGESCKAWLDKHVKKVGRADHGINRTIKGRGLFLVAPDEDE